MPFTVTLPKLSPTMEEGQIAKWHKKEGEYVESGDLLLEISTDKATVEYTALDPGYLRKILAKEGDSAVINAPIAIFTEKKDENIANYKPEGIAEEKPKVEKKESVKVSASKPSVQKVMSEQPVFAPEQPLQEYQFPFPTKKLGKRLFASPLAKRIAEEKGIDLTTIKGTGPHGRVMSRDLPMGQQAAEVSFSERKRPTHLPGSYDEEGLTPIRRAIATKLQQSKSSIPHFYVSLDIDPEPLLRSKEELKAGGVKVSVNDFVLRAAALALHNHPEVNSGFNSENQTLIRFKTVDIAVAVSISEGLITPIIRLADLKNLGELSVEVRELAARAKAGKLEEHEYKGGSFTISNMGMYGITHFQAILNPPQAAIVAVGGIRDEAVVCEGKIIPGKRMTLSLSCDHRVVDGEKGARFLQSLKHFLENPTLLVV